MNKYKLLGSILHFFYKILNFMINKKYYYAENYDKDKQMIIVFWHRKIFTVCNATKFIKKKASMVSSSNDGEILSEMLRREGNELIRGSSNKNNIKSLKQAMKFVKNNYTIGIAIDGPKGPIYEPKPGAIFIGQKTGIPIVSVGTYTDKVWIFEKMWDKLEIPKPFSKSINYLGEPYVLDKNLSLEDAIKIVKNKIFEAERKAEEIYKNNI